jgi:hypothetical protein
MGIRILSTIMLLTIYLQAVYVEVSCIWGKQVIVMNQRIYNVYTEWNENNDSVRVNCEETGIFKIKTGKIKVIQ